MKTTLLLPLTAIAKLPARATVPEIVITPPAHAVVVKRHGVLAIS